MKCPACSAENADGIDRCQSCGSILSNTSPTNGAASPPRMSRLAVASAILGIVSLPTFIIGALPTLIIGLVAIARIDRSGGKLRGKGLAIVGVAFSLVGVLNTLGFLVLAPTLRRVGERARAKACMVRLKEWGIVFRMYASDNNGNFMEGVSGSRSGHNGWITALSPYHQWDVGLTTCPSATRPFLDEYGLTLADSRPGSATAWGYWRRKGWPKPMAGSYGINGWCYNPAPGQAYRKPEEDYWRTPNVQAAASVPLLLGAKRPDVWPQETDEPLASEHQPWPGHGQMSFVGLNRHDGSNNCLFLDFSVRSVRPREVYTLQWHREYNTAGPWTTAGGAAEEDWPRWMQRRRTARLPAKDERVWVKCRACGEGYQMTARQYHVESEEKSKVSGTPWLLAQVTCRECGEQSISRAEKCESCGCLFLRGTDPADFPDRCPECSFSKTEAQRKKRLGH